MRKETSAGFREFSIDDIGTGSLLTFIIANKIAGTEYLGRNFSAYSSKAQPKLGLHLPPANTVAG